MPKKDKPEDSVLQQIKAAKAKYDHVVVVVKGWNDDKSKSKEIDDV